MLTPELQKEIDSKWNACWPLNILRPIAILDLVSYLFFFKKISGHILVSENAENKLNPDVSNSKKNKIISWTTFKVMDEQSMHSAFACENGVLDLIKKYHRNSAYELFLKGNLLLSPTPKLLFNAASIIRLIEDSNEGTKGSIFEYLLNKTEVNGQNGQAFLPEYLIEIIISIIQPNERDWIMDPAAGNAGLLVKSLKNISRTNPEFSRDSNNNFNSGRFVGIDSDLINLRIGGMNMILHGIPNPELKLLNSSLSFNSITREQPSVFLANLVFIVSENKTVSEGNSARETSRNELFHLNFILKNSQPGTRVAVIVPDAILYNTGTEIVRIRQEIIDNFKLKGVISVNDKTIPGFWGTSILIFSKESLVTTDKVWFYKIENKAKNNKENKATGNPGNSNHYKETIDSIKQFLNRDSRVEKKNPDFFYITADDIRSRNYNISYNEYILFLNQGITNTGAQSDFIEKENRNNQIKNQPLFPAAGRIPPPKKRNAKKIIIIGLLSVVVLSSAFLSYWVFYLKKDFLFLKKPAMTAIPAKDPAITIQTTNQANNIKLPDSTNVIATKYVVITKAYFYSTPDLNSRRSIYINRFVNAILTATEERNGFVYVVYVNKRGETTKGWLNKKDLRKLP